LSIAIITLKPYSQIKTLDTLHCPVPYNLLFCRTKGYGKARNVAASYFKPFDLMVQFNDDLVLSSQIWNHILSLGQEEFMLTHDGPNLCSRVLAIHVNDFWKINGCDSSIKYCFEDGDFAYRAQQAGLKLKILSPEFAKHISHKHSFYNPKHIVPITWEFCKMYVKYKRNFTDDPMRFFFPFHDYRVLLQHFLLRITFTLTWIIKGTD